MVTESQAPTTVLKLTIVGDSAEGFNVAGALARLLDKNPAPITEGWSVRHPKAREVRVREIGPFLQEIVVDTESARAHALTEQFAGESYT